VPSESTFFSTIKISQIRKIENEVIFLGFNCKEVKKKYKLPDFIFICFFGFFPICKQKDERMIKDLSFTSGL
jgi:hypothetical protein